MKLDLSQIVLDTNKREVLDPEIGKDGKPTGKNIKRTLRQNLIRVLSAQFDRNLLKEPKEYTWIYSLATLIRDAKEDIIEIDDEKLAFIKKLIGNNKMIFMQSGPQGLIEKEGFIFTPFEAGQTLDMLGGL